MDGTNKYQCYRECIDVCPSHTKANEDYICQIYNTSICTSSKFKLDLEQTISQENVQIVEKNYVYEFYYKLNHIAQFWAQILIWFYIRIVLV